MIEKFGAVIKPVIKSRGLVSYTPHRNTNSYAQIEWTRFDCQFFKLYLLNELKAVNLSLCLHVECGISMSVLCFVSCEVYFIFFAFVYFTWESFVFKKTKPNFKKQPFKTELTLMHRLDEWRWLKVDVSVPMIPKV